MALKNGTPRPRSRLSLVLITVLAPFLLIGVLELVFRLSGVGVRQPLFIDGPVTGYLQPNPTVIQRFFVTPQAAPNVRIEPTYFLAEKPKDGLRVVVQGASSAAGFPYGRMTSPAGMLRQRLQRTYPERTVEVISTALPVANSYALLDFADEIVDIEPDAVIIYAGHNEFFGVLGVGSAYASNLSPDLTRLILNLRRLHIVEAGFQVYGAAAPVVDEDGPLMAGMVRDQRIPFGGELFTAGLVQFRENLALLLQEYRRNEIPVLIGTLASNEKDLSPFIPADLPMSVAGAWQQTLAGVQRALETARSETAALKTGELVKLAPENALSWFLQGQASLLRKRSSEARHAFLKAKDLDQLRFRAPESFNDIIRAIALEHRAVLVDVQQALAAHSPEGIIGDELVLDHLHPDVEGYFYMADAYYDAMVDMAQAVPDEEIGEATARGEMPVTAVDRLVGGWRVQRLLHQWPFVPQEEQWAPPKPKTELERIARELYDNRISWTQAMSRTMNYLRDRDDPKETIRVASALSMAVPFESGPAYVAGSALLEQGQPDRALPYLRRCVRLEPRNATFLIALAEALQETGRKAESLAVAERIIAIEPENNAASTLIEDLQKDL